MAENSPFHQREIGVIKVTHPEPANCTLRKWFTTVHKDFGNKDMSRGHVYNEWPTEVSAFLLQCLRDVTTKEVVKALSALKSGPAAYEELLGYYEWWLEKKPKPGWMEPTIALDSVVLAERKGVLLVPQVPGMVKNPNWFNFPDLWLYPQKGPWPEKTCFLAVRGRGFED
ncbi:MAG: hypothetical protein AAB668_03440 [Patescibacteria group bacterium]